MPDYSVVIRYRLEWTAEKTVKAKNEEVAQEKVEKMFEKIADYAAFEKFVADDSFPQLDVEELEVEDVNEA